MRIRFGQIAPRPRWDGIVTYRGTGAMAPLDHIKARHFWRPGGAKVPRSGGSGGMFAKGTTKADLEVYARVLHKEGRHVRLSDGGWKISGPMQGRVVGLTAEGKRTSVVEMILSRDGLIKTMYPAK